MAQFNTLNVKLSNSHINRLKSGIKNGTEVISSNVFGDWNDENSFQQKLLLTNTQVTKFHSAEVVVN